MTQTLYLRCAPGEVAPRVLLTGDPGRLDLIGALLEEVHEIGYNREFRIITGHYGGEPVSAVSAGIGAPSTAIALEELKQVGVQAVVRVGTMMGVAAPLGAAVLPTGAVRQEGTSPRYLPLEYPAVPNWELTRALARSTAEAGLELYLGLSATYDAFYPDMAPALGAGHHAGPDYDQLRQCGVLSLDMESALLFVAGHVLGLATAALCLVTVQVGSPPTFLEGAQRDEQTRRVIGAALRGVLAYPVDLAEPLGRLPKEGRTR